jgi:hypothetical protein
MVKGNRELNSWFEQSNLMKNDWSGQNGMEAQFDESKLERWFLKLDGIFSWAEIASEIWWESKAT